MNQENLVAVPIQRHVDERGALTPLENLPFEIQRVFALTHLNTDLERANHAVNCDEFIVLLTGSCRLTLRSRAGVMLDTELGYDVGHYIPAGFWIKLGHFSPDTTILVLASKSYEDTRYFSEPQR